MSSRPVLPVDRRAGSSGFSAGGVPIGSITRFTNSILAEKFHSLLPAVGSLATVPPGRACRLGIHKKFHWGGLFGPHPAMRCPCDRRGSGTRCPIRGALPFRLEFQMDLPATASHSDPHSQRVTADAVEWRVRLEPFAEMRAQLDADAADLVPQRSP
jgi:hypothetical protein